MEEHTNSGHDRKGKFAKGNTSRRDFREKRQRGIARYIGESTNGGHEMVDSALEIMRDKAHPARLKAIEWLMLRYAGKVADKLEVSGPDGSPLAGMTPDQLLSLAKAKVEGK